MSNDKRNDPPPSIAAIRAGLGPFRGIGERLASKVQMPRSGIDPAPKVEPPKQAPAQHVNGAVVDTAKQAHVGNHMAQFLRDYYFVMVGKDSLVATWKMQRLPGGGKQKVLQLITRSAFEQHYADKKDVVTDGEGGKTTVPVAKRFLEKAKRYEGLVYEPNEGSVVDGDRLNMWQGFGVTPQAGHWPILKQHVTEVLAAGNQEYADYIIKWVAWAFQNPGNQAEVIMAFMGGKGSGKGVFARGLCRIFGSHGLQISSPEHLVGKHNKHLQHCSLLFADEAFWAGDKKNEGVLKRMATEPTMTVEPKWIDAYSVRNCLHIIMATNEDWIVPASPDERRYAVFRVSNCRVGDRDYFKALHQEIENGGLAAMLYELKHMDLGDWHPRQDVPDTEALGLQKRMSMKALDQLIFGMAMNGRLPDMQGMRLKRLSNVLLTDNEQYGFGFVHYAKSTQKGLHFYSGARLKAEMKDRWGAMPYSGAGKRGIIMPSLGEIRERFEKLYGKIEWDNPDLEDWDTSVATGDE